MKPIHATLSFFLLVLVGHASAQARPSLSVEFRIEDKLFRSFFAPTASPGGGATLAEVEADLSAELAGALEHHFGYLRFQASPAQSAQHHMTIDLASKDPERQGSTIVQNFFELRIGALPPQATQPRRLTFRAPDRYVDDQTTPESLRLEIVRRFDERLQEQRESLVRDLFVFISLGKSAFLHVQPQECHAVLPFSFCQIRAAAESEFMIETDDGNDHHFHGTQASQSSPARIPDLPPLYGGGIKLRERGEAVRTPLPHTTIRVLRQDSGEIPGMIAVYITRYVPDPDDGRECTPANLEL